MSIFSFSTFKKTKILVVLFFVIISMPIVSKAQVFDSLMNVYEEQYPHEKIHIQFDRNIYNSGETIFYKLYVLAGME